MELSAVEMAGMNKLHDAALWAGLGGAARQSLFGLLGVEGTTPVRNIGIIPKHGFATIVSTWTLPAPTPDVPTATVPPTANQVGQAGLLGRACRVKCGTEENRLGASSSASSLNAMGAPAKKAKLSNVIYQANDAEEALLDKSEVQKAFNRYKKAFGDPLQKKNQPLARLQLFRLCAVQMARHLLILLCGGLMVTAYSRN